MHKGHSYRASVEIMALVQFTRSRSTLALSRDLYPYILALRLLLAFATRRMVKLAHVALSLIRFSQLNFAVLENTYCIVGSQHPSPHQTLA